MVMNVIRLYILYTTFYLQSNILIYSLRYYNWNRPCGTVVMIGELYGAESKGQVYGNVHTFLSENTEAADKLGNTTYIHTTFLYGI